MRQPIFVRELRAGEREVIEEALRTSEAFTLRRAQIVLASARREWVPRIAEQLACGEQTVRNAIHAFNARGIGALHAGSPRPHTIRAAIDESGAERLRALLHQSPRTFGKPTSVWTLALAAEVSFAEGITAERVSDETIRQAIGRLGIGWKRAKRWITSPDPAYARKKGGAIA
jgi:transposase